MHTQIELSAILQVVLPIFLILSGINGYFIRALVVKIEESERAVLLSTERIAKLQREMEDTRQLFSQIAGHLGKIDSDVAVLKFAILKQIKKMESAAATES